MLFNNKFMGSKFSPYIKSQSHLKKYAEREKLLQYSGGNIPSSGKQKFFNIIIFEYKI